MSTNQWYLSNSFQINLNYFTSVNLIKAAIQTVKTNSLKIGDGAQDIIGLSLDAVAKMPTNIVFVGSMLSTLSFVGYSAYSGSKFALRGFAEALRSEMKVVDCHVSMYLPGTMDTPGYEAETLGKPLITKNIEGTSTMVGPEKAAQDMLMGVLSGKFCFSNDLVGELARCSVQGGSPRTNLFLEALVTPVLALIFAAWAMISDREVRQFFKI